ncbi:MAG: hypothetical protein ABIW49_06190 [Knoellia sp.]
MDVLSGAEESPPGVWARVRAHRAFPIAGAATVMVLIAGGIVVATRAEHHSISGSLSLSISNTDGEATSPGSCTGTGVQATKDKAAGALRKQANEADTKAQSLMTAATARRDAAAKSLSSAQMSSEDRESGDALALAAWKGNESARRRELDAQNRVLDDCRREARPAAVAATVLGIGGVGLLAWDILGRRQGASRKAE